MRGPCLSVVKRLRFTIDHCTIEEKVCNGRAKASRLRLRLRTADEIIIAADATVTYYHALPKHAEKDDADMFPVTTADDGP